MTSQAEPDRLRRPCYEPCNDGVAVPCDRDSRGNEPSSSSAECIVSCCARDWLGDARPSPVGEVITSRDGHDWLGDEQSSASDERAALAVDRHGLSDEHSSRSNERLLEPWRALHQSGQAVFAVFQIPPVHCSALPPAMEQVP